MILDFKASLPPRSIAEFPDLKLNIATSEVTFGRASYITPNTPIGIVTRFMIKLLGRFHLAITL